MDNYRGNDAEVDGIFDGDSEDDWADSHVIERVTEDLVEAYVTPLDSATQSKHLAAIADAISQTARSPRPIAAAQRPITDGSRCASSFVRAAGTTRTPKQVPTVSLASPFGARKAGTSSAPGHRSRTTLTAVVSQADPKTPQVKWLRPGAFVNSIASKAAVVATAIALSASGLAIAGGLPDPVQTAFSEAAGVIGLDLPAPIQPPAVSPAPPREQAVPALKLPEPQPVIPQAPAPAPIVAAPEPAAPTPVVQTPQPQAQAVAPAAPPADLEIWLTELIRQALAAANAKAMNPQAQTDAGSGQQSVQSGAQPWTQDNPWQTYSWNGTQANPDTQSSGSGSRAQSQPTQGKPQTRPAPGSTNTN